MRKSVFLLSLLIVLIGFQSSSTPELLSTPVARKTVSVSREPTNYLSIPLEPRYQALVKQLSDTNGLDFLLVVAIAGAETGETYDVNTVGVTGDLGLFQLNPNYCQYFAEQAEVVNEPLEAVPNIKMALCELTRLRDFWQDKGKQGVDLENCILSSYNKGIAGFNRYGYAVQYISKVNRVRTALVEEVSNES